MRKSIHRCLFAQGGCHITLHISQSNRLPWRWPVLGMLEKSRKKPQICHPAFQTKSLFLSLQSWCRCLWTGGDQALDLQPYSAGLTFKKKKKSNTHCGGFNLHSSRFCLISYVSVHYNQVLWQRRPRAFISSTLSFVFLCFFSVKGSYLWSVDTTLFCLAMDRKQSIYVMSNSAISSICISTLEQFSVHSICHVKVSFR